MKITRLNRLCDRTLKALLKEKESEPFLYEINEMGNENILKSDFFKAIKIKESEIPYIIDTLSHNKFISLTEKGGSTSTYNQQAGKLIRQSVYRISITRDGKLFINSSSFKIERLKSMVKSWWPLIVSTIALSVSIIVAVMNTRKSQVTEKKVEAIEKSLNDFRKNVDALKIDVDTLLGKKP